MSQKMWDFGSYQCTFEEPNLLVARHIGEVDETAMGKLVALSSELNPGQKKICLLIDLTQANGMTPGARKASAAHQDANADASGPMAFFGGSFAMRTLVNMMMRALTLMGKLKSPFVHVATEAEAREWLRVNGHYTGPSSPT